MGRASKKESRISYEAYAAGFPQHMRTMAHEKSTAAYSLVHHTMLERTAERCAAYVARDAMQLKYVPKKLRTEALCQAAVAQNAAAAQYVPRKFRTWVTFEPVVDRYPAIVGLIARGSRTAAMYEKAMQHGLSRRRCPPAWRPACEPQQKIRFEQRTKKVSKRKRGEYVPCPPQEAVAAE